MRQIISSKLLTLLTMAFLAVALNFSNSGTTRAQTSPDVAPAAQTAEAPAATQDSAAPAKKPRKARKKKKANAAKSVGYFVEFRARTALSYGHTFLVHGRLDAKGRITTSEVAGLHPAGDDPTPWVIGHFIPVKSETGASDGDTEDQYIAAAYRINLTAEQYQRVSTFIRKLQKNSPMWHAVLYNCNAFVGDVAQYMGLDTPGSLEFPKEYINGLKSRNDARTTMNEAASRTPLFMGNRND